MKRIYLDHAATTPTRPEVIAAMLPHLACANPGSLHAEGRAARCAVDDARAAVARRLGAKPREIVFTASGSEADNLAVLGAARARRSNGMHAITSAVEHRAVLGAFEALRDEGFEVSVLPVDGHGRVDPESFRRAITPRTTFASVMFANNEIGTVQAIADLAAIARERGVIFHTDAVQAAGQLALDVGELGIDLLSLSAHKFYGPKGVGALYVRRGTPVSALLLGGSQEMGMRAGTENVAGIVGLAAALELATSEMTEASTRVMGLRDRLEAGVLGAFPNARINGGGAVRLPSVSNVSFPNVEGRTLLVRLDLEGIAVSVGSACAAGTPERSHVIAALGEAPWVTAGAIRFSLGRMTTEDEIDSVLNRLPGMAAELEVYT
jgi:cysteine desulfurase